MQAWFAWKYEEQDSHGQNAFDQSFGLAKPKQGLNNNNIKQLLSSKNNTFSEFNGNVTYV